MTDTEQLLSDFFKEHASIAYIKPEDIPNIPLYMDQLTTFMDEQLDATKRHAEDKILTKTMINNYAKNRLLPPPNKKKYSKDHLLLLIFIYYLKNMLSIGDIQKILTPMTEDYVQKKKETSLTDVYREICDIQKSRLPLIQKNIADMYQSSTEAFPSLPKKEKKDLQRFVLISNLCFDVYVKSKLIERLIDDDSN